MAEPPRPDSHPSVFALLRRYGVDPKRSLGQNFLVDERHLARIAAAADLVPADTVLEIGPGLGVLTRHLATWAGRVIGVELDGRLIDVLRDLFAGQSHVSFVQGDILEMDPAELVQPADRLHAALSGYKVVANLPYYITSAVLRHLLENRRPPDLAVVMVQKEVAQRICAGPGEMSLLAVGVQFYARPQIVQRVPAGAFYPRPKVDSAVLRLDVMPEPAVAGVDVEQFFKVVRAGFGQKRKQLSNSLSAGLDLSKVAVEDALRRAGIDPQRRAQTLSLSEWGRLCRAIDDSHDWAD